MQFTYDKKIIEKPLHFFYKQGTYKLPKSLREKNYATPFNVFKNWNLVRTFVIKRYKFTSDYIHLIEKE